MNRPSFSTVWRFATGRVPKDLPARVRRGVTRVALADLVGCVAAIPSVCLDISMLFAGVGTAARATISLLMLLKFLLVVTVFFLPARRWRASMMLVLLEAVAWFLPFGHLLYLLFPYSWAYLSSDPKGITRV